MTVPQNWIAGPLADFVESVSTGPFGSILHKRDYITGGIPVINPVNLVNGRIAANDAVSVADETADRLVNYRLQAGDILIARRGDIGRCGLVEKSHNGWLCGTGCFYVRPSSEVDPKFLTLLIGSPEYREKLVAASTGTTMLNISNRTLASLPIELPGLEEQKRIVAVLDQAFAALDRARALAEANLADAEELFESYRHEVLARDGIEYVDAPLSSIASFAQGKQIGLKEQSLVKRPKMVRFIRIVDYTQSGTEHRFVDDPGERYHVENDDIVMVRYGSPGLVGRGEEGVIANNMFKVNADKSKVSNDYLTFALKARSVQDFLGSRGSSTMPALNFGHLDEVIIRYPPLDAQGLIVAGARAIEKEVSRLRLLYEDKLRDLADLRQSLLQKAFAGELT